MKNIKEGADKSFDKINKKWIKKHNKQGWFKKLFGSKSFDEIENCRTIYDIGFKEGYLFGLKMAVKSYKGEIKNIPVNWK